MESFLDTPELNHRFQLIEEIIEEIKHLPTDIQKSIVFSWIDMETIEQMHKTICKDKY